MRLIVTRYVTARRVRLLLILFGSVCASLGIFNSGSALAVTPIPAPAPILQLGGTADGYFGPTNFEVADVNIAIGVEGDTRRSRSVGGGLFFSSPKPIVGQFRIDASFQGINRGRPWIGTVES